MKYSIITINLILFILSISEFCFAQDSDMPHGDDFNLDCELCHSTIDWSVSSEQAEFKHEDTGFPLLGEHTFVNCRSCHESLIFNRIGHACADCHTDVHAGKLGIQCENCHTPVDWDNRVDIFRLHENSLFPLTGVHAVLDCQICHKTEQYNDFSNTNVDCKNCHLNDYMHTLNPSHQKSGFDLQCENCHRPNLASWKNAFYIHSNKFPLIGGHSNLECIACHKETYTNTTNECVTCHQTDYSTAINPNHQTFGFPTICERCHNINSWTGTVFDHVEASGFALNGIHSTIQCLDCHVNNRLTGLPRDCFGCHYTDYNSANDPNHQQGGFSHICLDCHNENDWSPAEFDHDQTNFPLTGAHFSVVCTDCHTNNQFAGTPTECYACHEQDYQSVEDPDHVTNNFDKVCTSCHNTTTWETAIFDHSQTSFPLDGAHTNQSCISCHVIGYTNTPLECIGCHESDYDNTNEPNHTSALFPTDCQNCHNTSRWDDASWDHDGQYFPIYSGTHREAWNNCADCHVNTSNYSQYECITCHEHSNKADVDNDHDEVSGYIYESVACKTCHPDGRAEDD